MDMNMKKGGKGNGGKHKDLGGGKMWCPNCKVEVTPKPDGTCPGCGNKLK